MRKKLIAIIMVMAGVLTAPAQTASSPSWPRALGDFVFANGTIHLIDRMANIGYSHVTLHSIYRNFRSGFAWDNNLFFINQLGHPFQGGLSFNAARNNGFSFAQSVPFTVAGTLVWEFFGETEQPSINDVITTSFAGTLFGEGSYRLAELALDDGDTGGRRVLREATAAFLNPLQGLHRLFSGRMWKVKRNGASYSSAEAEDETNCSVTLSDRYVVASDGKSHGRHHPFVTISAAYGETADDESHSIPYDFLAVDGALAFGGGQPVIPRLSVTARLCSTPVLTKEKTGGELGLYQFYMYEDTRLGDSLRGPFPFGETASLGPGVIVKSRQESSGLALEQRLFARGVILGSAESDYYKCYERHYNMGSGYGASSMTRLSWKDAVSLQLDAYYLHLYTWRSYEPRDVTTIETNDLNVLGDCSHARLLKLDMQLQARLTHHCGMAFGAGWFLRNTHYKYHPDSWKEGYELRAGLSWNF